MVDIGLSSTTIKLMQEPEGSDIELLQEMSLGGSTEQHLPLRWLMILMILNGKWNNLHRINMNRLDLYPLTIDLSYSKVESDYATMCNCMTCSGTMGECTLPPSIRSVMPYVETVTDHWRPRSGTHPNAALCVLQSGSFLVVKTR